MQTIWVLMGTTGFIESPFQLVKSIRKDERGDRPAVVPVELDIETFYKVYKTAEPGQVASEEQGIFWDPLNFRTQVMKNLYTEARRFAQIKVSGTAARRARNWKNDPRSLDTHQQSLPKRETRSRLACRSLWPIHAATPTVRAFRIRTRGLH